MTPEEAMKKAQQGYELGIIPYEKIEEYAKHLYKKHINKPSTDENKVDKYNDIL